MAEVTGILGDQPIELNNAATEATLKQLLAATMAMAKMSGKDKKFEQKLEKELNDLAKAAKEQAKAQSELTKEQRDALKQAKELAKQADEDLKRGQEKKKSDTERKFAEKELMGGIKEVGKELYALAMGASKLISGLANTGDSLKSAAGALGNIPVVGALFAQSLGAMAEATERSYEAYKKSASVGANFAGSMNAMIAAASGAGLTIDQFSNVVVQTAPNLIYFNGTVADGAKRFAQIGKTMRNSGLNDQLLALGYSTEEINSGMGSYIGVLARSGKLQGMSDAQLAKSSAEYLQELDALAQVTGKSRKEQQADMDRLMSSAKYQLALRKMDADTAKVMSAMVTTLPKDMQQAAEDIVTQGGVFSEAAIKLNTTMPGLARDLTEQSRIAKAGGKVSLDAIDMQQNNAKREAKARLGQLDGLLTYTNEYDGMTKGMIELESRSSDKLSKARDARIAAEKGGAKPKEIGNFKQEMAESSNVFTQALLETKDGLNTLKKAFDAYAEFVMKIAVPANNALTSALSWITDKFTGILGPVLGGLLLASLPLIGALGQVVIGFRLLSAQLAMQRSLAKIADAGGTASKVGKAAEAAAAKGSGWFAKMGEMLSSVGSKLGGVFGRMGSVLGRVLPYVLNVGKVLLRFAGWIGLAIAAVELIAWGLKALGVDFEEIGNKISDAFGDSLQAVSDFGNYISDNFMNAFYKVKDFLEDVFIPIFDIVSDVITDFFITPIKEFGEYLKGIFQPIFESIGNFFKTIWMETVSAVNGAMQWLGEVFNSVGTLISDVTGSIGEAFSAITGYIKESLGPVFEYLGNKVKEVFSIFSAIPEKLARFIRGFDSWSSVFTYMGNMFKGFALTLKEISFGLRDKLSFLPGITAPTEGERNALERERKELADAKAASQATRDAKADERAEMAALKQRDRDKERSERDKNIADSRATRDKKRDDAVEAERKRREARDKAHADKKNASEETKAEADAKTAEAAAAEAEGKADFGAKKGIDYSNPVRMLESFGKQQKSKLFPDQPATSTGTPAAAGNVSNGGNTGGSSGGKAVTIKNAAGEDVETRTGGNRNWRNNNPGNIEYGPFAKSMGAVGSDGRFAIFPSEEMGRKAADTLLKGKNYAELSGAQAISRWAPSSDNNDPKAYAAKLGKMAGIDMNKKYKDMSPDEQSKFLDAMTKIEGGQKGTVVAGKGKLSGGVGTATTTGVDTTTTTTPTAPLDASGRQTAATDPRLVTSKPSPTATAAPTATATPTAPADAFAGLVLNGINPTTFALQDLVKKGINPLSAILVKANPQAPSSAQVNGATTPSATTAPDQSTKDKDAKDKAEAEARAKKATSNAASSQETPESLLAQLNMKMDQLIQVSARTADLNDRQLSVQRGLGSGSINV